MCVNGIYTRIFFFCICADFYAYRDCCAIKYRYSQTSILHMKLLFLCITIHFTVWVYICQINWRMSQFNKIINWKRAWKIDCGWAKKCIWKNTKYGCFPFHFILLNASANKFINSYRNCKNVCAQFCGGNFSIDWNH